MVQAVAKRQKSKRSLELPKTLNMPIRWTGPVPHYVVRGLIESEEQFAARKKAHELECETPNRAVITEIINRLMLLAKHLGIETTRPQWEFVLSYRLALIVCRGFDVDYRDYKRRPKVWDSSGYFKLIAHVEAMKREKNCKDSEACKYLVQRAVKTGRGPYLPTKRSTVAQATHTLANRLVEARNPTFNTFARLLKLDDSPEYERYMLDGLIEMFGLPEID